MKEYHHINVNSIKSNTSIVHYIPFQQYSIDNPPDVFIAWRYWISLGLLHSRIKQSKQKTKTFLWLHDLLEPNQIPREIIKYVCSFLFYYVIIILLSILFIYFNSIFSVI